jgi:hypothetical protein
MARWARGTRWTIVGLAGAALWAWPVAAGTGAPSEAGMGSRLEALAAAAARQPEPAPLAPGEQRYQRWRSTTLVTTSGPRGAFSRLELRTSERWVGRDGAGRWRSACEASVLVGPRDRARWRAAGSPGDALCVDDDGRTRAGLGPLVPLADELGALPRDAVRLRARLRRAGGAGRGPLTDEETFTLVGALLEVPTAPPGARGALLRVAAGLRGVRATAGVTDPMGRRGIALTMTGPRARQELILAPRTGAVLAERTVSRARLDWADARPGTLLGWVAFLDSAVVEEPSY